MLYIASILALYSVICRWLLWRDSRDYEIKKLVFYALSYNIYRIHIKATLYFLFYLSIRHSNHMKLNISSL